MATPAQVKQNISKAPAIRPMSPEVVAVRNNVNLMVEVMRSVMKNGVHFGVIPGVDKPSLFKAGAEKIMATFRLSADPEVEELSKDGEIRFRVKVRIATASGAFVGAGIGECSSGEEKYMWRAAVCQEEYDATTDERKRIKFKKYQGQVSKIQQVRVPPSDLANTILKMAKKRGLVDGVLTSTGASDIFSQDIEDLPEEYVESQVVKATPAQTETADNAAAAPTERSPITEEQRKYLLALARGKGKEKESINAYILEKYAIDSTTKIPVFLYSEICAHYKAMSDAPVGY